MVENCEYPLHGMNIISLNTLVNEVIEPQISMFCWKHNLEIRVNSRDLKKVVMHFIANSVVEICGKYVDLVNVFNFTPLTLKILDDQLLPMVEKCVLKLMKTFDMCTTNIDAPINQLQQHHIDDMKIVVQQCRARKKTLAKAKKFLVKHDLTALSKELCNNVATQYILSK